MLRVHLNWGGKLGVATRRPVDGADPSDPAYNWSRYDDIVLRAADQHVQVLFTIFGSPAWTNGGQLPTRAPHRAADLVDFSFAAAQRYGGEFMRDDGTVLPRVRYWTAWNEPNLTIGLVPQWKRVGKHWVIQSAIDYARICNAVVDGVRGTLIPGEKIACGDTGPRGNNAPLSERPTTSPIAFLRAMKRAGAAGFDAYAHHPYPSGPSETPTTRPTGSTAVTFGNLDTLVSEVTRLYGHKEIWLDEYGYQTNPPDDDLGVTPAKQARFLTRVGGARPQEPSRDDAALVPGARRAPPDRLAVGARDLGRQAQARVRRLPARGEPLAHAEELREQRLLHVQAVLRLVPDRRPRRRRARPR